MVKEKPPKKEREPVTLDGLAAVILRLEMRIERLDAKVDGLATRMDSGFSFFGERVGDLEHRFEHRLDHFQDTVAANTSQIEGLYRRIDDIAETRASRQELAATNGRVTRIEGKLKLA